ncbi:MAG TPA: hypothetical protein VFR12_04430 [Pyrinomonadaceae bacterium]|nr:hypothetical protein [Pyrinomonadaceae bacterium]
MKRVIFILVVCGAVVSVANAQSDASQQLLQLQEAEVEKLTASTEQLRPLYEDGLIARLEFEKAEKDLADAKAKVEDTRLTIANAEKLAAEQKKTAELAKSKSLVKATSMSLGRSSVVTRSTAGSWSLASLSSVQQFFSKTFGKALPISTIGQSATHNRMGWDHRNSVDVGIHPDSAEGRVLMAHLQSSGIPFLAFRSAIPGVSTGPHIHIGAPSHRL